VRTFHGTRLGLYFIEYGAAPRPVRVLYDRRDSAFSRLTVDEVDWDPVRRARIVHITGITPALGANGRALISRVLEEAPAISFDMNYRAALSAPAEAREVAESILPRARYVFMGRTEARTVFEMDGTAETVLNLLSRQAPRAVIALLEGAAGSTVVHGGELWRPTVQHSVHLVDPIGAGDAYVAGYLWGALTGRSPQETVNIAATVAALKCSHWGDIAVVTPADIQDALSAGPDVRR